MDFLFSSVQLHYAINLFFNWGLLVITVLTVVMFHLQIVKVEEAFLIKTFGEEYLEYRKKVCRYIGRKR